MKVLSARREFVSKPSYAVPMNAIGFKGLGKPLLSIGASHANWIWGLRRYI